jgi:hypothetical protein
MEIAMTDAQRAEFRVALVEQEKAGVHVDVGGRPSAPAPEHVVSGVADNVASAVGMPASYHERADDGSIAATVSTLDGVPTRLTPGADLNKLLVQAGGIPMTIAQAIQHGYAVQHRDGRVVFADELEAQVKAGGKPAANNTPTTEKTAGPTPGSPEADHIALGDELSAADAAWQQHGALNSAQVALAVLRGDDAKLQAAVDILVRTGLATDGVEAMGWVDDVARHAEAQLVGVLDGMSLDGRAVVNSIAQDKTLAGPLELAVIRRRR